MALPALDVRSGCFGKKPFDERVKALTALPPRNPGSFNALVDRMGDARRHHRIRVALHYADAVMDALYEVPHCRRIRDDLVDLVDGFFSALRKVFQTLLTVTKADTTHLMLYSVQMLSTIDGVSRHVVVGSMAFAVERILSTPVPEDHDER